MHKVSVCALMISLLLLSACGVPISGSDEEKNAAQMLQEEYQMLTSCEMEGVLHCELNDETAEYTLHCSWSQDGTSTVEILQPEMLAGIRAELDGNGVRLSYEDVSLSAGVPDAETIAPVQVLPLVMNAIREGYLLEQGVDAVDGTDCLRLLFDTTGASGGKVDYAVWFGAGHAPVRAEVLIGETVPYTVSFTAFSAGNE